MDELLKEMEDIKNYPSDILPHYGYGDKKELIQIIENEIALLSKPEEPEDDMKEEEADRKRICEVQGLSRWI
jgi:hypothetical protein